MRSSSNFASALASSPAETSAAAAPAVDSAPTALRSEAVVGTTEVEDSASHATAVLQQLCSVCDEYELAQLGERLQGLAVLVGRDLVAVSQALTGPLGCHGPVQASAEHLVGLGGKRLRPLCLALAARVGQPSDGHVRDLGVAVELIHSATLLHDDVVDLGETRRGAPSARLIYGNAASIFAGDLLLIDAIRKVVNTGLPKLLPSMLDAIDEMIAAESLQLTCRDLLVVDIETYQGVVVGKTGALFGWALRAGGRAGGCSDQVCDALESFGRELGHTFQLVDDLLDLCGEPEQTGKNLFADLREGKATYPLILAMSRDESLRPRLEALLAAESGPVVDVDAQMRGIVDAIGLTGAIQDTRAVAAERSKAAIGALEGVPEGPARSGLAGLCELLLSRIR